MKTIFRFIRNLLTLLAILYLLLAAALFAGAFAVDSGTAGVLRNFLVTGLLAAPILLLLMLLIRRWRVALALAVPAAGLLLVYGTLLIPRAEISAAASAGELTLLTFNVEAVEKSLDTLVAVIEDAGADVVALQELSRAAADYFEAELADRYPYMALHPQTNGFQGQGILSVYPIEADTYWINRELKRPLGHMRVALALGPQTIVLYNTHPTPPFSVEWGLNTDSHSAAIAKVLKRVAAETEPVLMAGDFNFTNQFAEYDRITGEAGFTDTFLEAGPPGLGFTYPDTDRFPLPLMRLDYVFHDANFTAREAYVWSDSGISDHRPILARFSLTRPQ